MIIEGTTRCTLACPGCPRTWFSEKFNRPFPKSDLVVDDLARFLDCESGRKVPSLTFNGNHGDPIYYPYLFDLLETFRDEKKFKLSTNGSHQTKRFWTRLAEILDKRDTVFFSIDGLEHNNHLYRRNSDWLSIMQAIEIMKTSGAKLIWKTLIFSYNEHEINQIKSVAESHGMIFVADDTNRYGDDNLVPSTEGSMSVMRQYIPNQIVELDPRCSDLEYISADGYYWPCCMISSFYTLHKTKLWKQRDLWDIRNQNLDQARVRLAEFKKEVYSDPANSHDVCKMHCKKGQPDFTWTQVDR